MKPLIAIGLVLLFSGCRKLNDVIHHYSPNTGCRINTVTQYVFNHSTVDSKIATVSYNKEGNPVQVSYDTRGTGSGWAFLKYDKHQRLIELNEENSARWRYVYKGLDPQPVRDTVYSHLTTATFVEYFTYDNKHRIIKVKGKFLYADFGDPSPDYERNYAYDAAGNLIVPGITYDNKVSVYRTHPVWMFIFRDYSMNNQGGALTYNNKNLPLDFGPVGGTYMRFFEGSFGSAQVNYTCK